MVYVTRKARVFFVVFSDFYQVLFFCIFSLYSGFNDVFRLPVVERVLQSFSWSTQGRPYQR